MSKRITFRVDDSKHQRIRDFVTDRDIDMSVLMNAAIDDYFMKDAAIAARLEGLRRALDDHQAQTIKALDTQLHRLGELIAMLMDEQTPKPTRSTKPKPTSTNSSVESHWDQVNNLNK